MAPHLERAHPNRWPPTWLRQHGWQHPQADLPGPCEHQRFPRDRSLRNPLRSLRVLV